MDKLIENQKSNDVPVSIKLSSVPETWQNVSAEIVLGYADWLIGRGYSIATINLYITTIRKYASLAFQAGFLPKSAWEEISNIKNYYGGKAKKINKERVEQNIPTQIGKRKTATHRTMTAEQAKKLKSFPSGTLIGRRANLIMCLLLDQGLKAKDVIQLQTEQIDIKAGVIHLERQNMGKQIHNLSMDTLNAIQSVFQHGDVSIPGPLLMRTFRDLKSSDHRMKFNSMYYIVRDIGESIGIDKLNISDCRAYWIQNMINFRTDLFELQIAGGWTTIESVIRNSRKPTDH